MRHTLMAEFCGSGVRGERCRRGCARGGLWDFVSSRSLRDIVAAVARTNDSGQIESVAGSVLDDPVRYGRQCWMVEADNMMER